MQNENHNESFYWKNELEALDSMPGETFNKACAWEKLHERLQKKRSDKKKVWYRAAACLVPAIFISLMFVHRNENNLVKNNIRKSGVSTPGLKQAEPLKKDVIAGISPGRAEKKTTIKSKIKNYKNNTVAGTNKELLEPNNNNQIAANEIILPVPVTDSTIAATVETVHLKKKLKVVHINELGDPVEASSEIAHHTDLHLFQLKLATQEVYNKSSVASNTTGFPVLKLKTSRN